MATKPLLDRYRAARELQVPLGKHNVTVRRPTELEVAREGGINLDFALRCVVGWDLLESDLLPGGAPEPVDFDPAVFAEWIADLSEFWRPIVDAVTDAYQKHKDATADRGNA